MSSSYVAAVLLGVAGGLTLLLLTMIVRRTLNSDTTSEVPLYDSYLNAIRRDFNEKNALQIEVIRDLLERTQSNVDDGGTVPSADQGDVVSELSHALGTPLAGIRAAIAVVAAERNALTEDSPHYRQIVSAVDLCQAFLSAYERVGDAFSSHDEQVAAIGNLPRFLQQAAASIGSDAATRVALSMELPEHIGRYSEMKIVPAIFPLLENAIEASSDGSTTISYSRSGVHLITIENPYSGVVPPDFEDDAITGRGGLHRGLGIGISRRLIGYLGGSCTFTDDAGIFRVVVRLPL